MKCENCGSECQENQKFCSECGYKLEPIEVVPEDNSVVDIGHDDKKSPEKNLKKIISITIISALLIAIIASFLTIPYYLKINDKVEKLYDEARKYYRSGDYKQTIAIISNISSNDMGKVQKDLQDKIRNLEKTSRELIAVDQKVEAEKEKNYLINSGKIKLGMTKEEVTKAWGKPGKINRTVGSYGIHEQWVYSSGKYLYFENGILTSWQD